MILKVSTKYAPAALVIGLVFALAGCGSNPAGSIHPLYGTGEKPVSEPRLRGEWTSFTLDSYGVSKDAQWVIEGQDGGCYRVERHKEDADKKAENDEREIYRSCLVSLDDKLFFDAEFSEKNVSGHMISAKDMAPNMVPVHLVGRVWAQQDFLRLARLSPQWVKQNVPEEQRESAGSAVVFTGSTQQLRSMMTQHGDDGAAMATAWYMCRPAADCGQRIVEDSLARAPNNMDVLEGAGWFSIAKADYVEALVRFRRRTEIDPSDAGARGELGVARLFQRDFKGARDDFAAAKKLDTDNDDDHSVDFLIAGDYFLEGNYAEAHKQLSKLQTSPDGTELWALVFDYACLSRLGRGKEAESFLAEQVGKFTGSQDDQLLLLRITGRINNFSPNFTSDELEQGNGLLYALVRIAKGDDAAARLALQQTLSNVDKRNPVFLAAKIELERLDAAQKK